jgi:glycosyltransferase involved in cell wall biosynthesis
MLVEGRVSTIIPVHNRPSLLREAVTSVLAQTYRPIEIIVVDDGSTDETGREAEALAEAHSEIRAIHRKNGGPGAARETGRVAASGEFIQYLDSDDLLLPRKFELQVAGLRECADCAVCYGKTRFYAYSDRPIDVAWKRTGERISAMFPSFLQSRWWGTSTALYRRAITDWAGRWTDLRSEEDWEYDCRIASKGVRLCYVDGFVSEERVITGARLSVGATSDPEKLRDRATAHKMILKHASAAGISHNTFEMQHFARELFLLARQCGAAGLADEARILFDLARQASGIERSRGIDFLLYSMGARLVGWRAMGTLARGLDRSRLRCRRREAVTN